MKGAVFSGVVPYMNKLVLCIIALVIILSGFYWYQKSNNPDILPSQSTVNTRENDMHSEFVAYTNAELGFSVHRPVDSTASVEQEGKSVKIMYLGPKAIPQSEITDGFTFTVYRDNLSPRTDLSAYAEERVAEIERNEGAIRSDLELVNVNGISAYRYSFKTVLENTAVEYILLSTSGVGYVITTSVFDPDLKGYERQIDEMLNSFVIS